MPVQSITLSRNLRSNVVNILDTQAQFIRSQTKISTGQRIASVVDGPNDFFRIQSLSSRSRSLGRIYDDINRALETVTAAIAGLDAINNLLDTMLSTISELRDSSDLGLLSTNAVAFNSYRAQISAVATAPTYLGRKLLLSSGGAFPTGIGVNFDTNTLYEIIVNTINVAVNTGSVAGADSQNGISLQQISGTAVSNFFLQSTNSSVATQADLMLTNVENQVVYAQNMIQSALQTFSTGATVLQLRRDFTQKYKRIVDDGQNRLQAADTTAEAANLSALQTRLQLGMTALGIATRSERGLLSLFR